jgi:putative ABC transport system permease protein
MNIAESIFSALKNVTSNKGRALLTMLGIVIGIGSVIIIMSVGAGSSAEINANFESMGVGRMNVSLQGGRNITRSDRLTLEDYDLLKDLPAFKFISPVYTAGGNNVTLQLLDPKKTNRASLTGVMEEYKDITSPEILYGRYLSANDVDMASKVAVIYDTTAEKVFGASDALVVGEKISLRTNRGSTKYTVVGVLKNPNAETERMYGDQFADQIFMPLSTLQRLAGTQEISQITLVVQDTDTMTETAAAITNILDTAHGTTEKYYVQNTMQMMEQINSTLGMVTNFISGVAAISLVVGGIGVMNIMLVTVTERTREIGIRKSIGARNGDIRTQFLIEAVILTGIGGALGLALGYGGGQLVGGLIGVPPVVTASAVLLAVGISTGIGIVFGVYPAGKAAKLDPIEALRYE